MAPTRNFLITRTGGVRKKFRTKRCRKSALRGQSLFRTNGKQNLLTFDTKLYILNAIQKYDEKADV
jgi:hypothetical protein